MVVIKEDLTSIRNRFDESSIDLWGRFAGVIGYSIETDQELKIELNPDRPDLFSFETLNAACNVFFEKAEIRPPSFGKSNLEVFVDPGIKKVRKYFFTFLANGPKIGEYLRPLIDYQERIHDSVGKDRKKVSIGIHDLSKIEPPIAYRPVPRKKLTFTTYDGMTGTADQILRKHQKGLQYAKLIETDEVPVIFDSAEGVLSVPPVINGSKSAISESSSSFFVDLTGNDLRAIRSAFYLLTNFFSVCGYKIDIPHHAGSPDPKDAEILNHDSRNVILTVEAIGDFLGIVVSLDSAKKLLERMGIQASKSKTELTCSIPGYRDDVMGVADVVEDLAKAIGYSHIPETRLSIDSIGSENADHFQASRARELLIGAGFQEVMTYFVTSRDIYSPFSDKQNYTIINPKNQEFSIIRNVLYPNMLHFLGVNRNRSTPQRIFEIGQVIEGMEEKTKLCIMILDSRSNYSMIKQSLDVFLTRSTGKRSQITGSDGVPFIPGRGGIVKIGKKPVGRIGELHPQYLEKFSLRLPVSFAELDLGLLFD